MKEGLGRNFWLFAVGRFVSQIGWAVHEVALPLYILDKTQSGGMMSVFVLADIIPSLIFMPFAGVVGDRYNRKALMVGFDLLRGVLLFGVIFLNLFQIYQLLILQIVLAIMSTFFGTSTSAMFPDLVESDKLERANSIVSSLSIVARLIGPALGGLVYAIGGVKLAFMINALSFFGSGIFELLIEYEWKTRELESFGEVINDINEGLSFLLSSRYLIVLMSFALFMNALGQPFGSVLEPYVYRIVLKLSSQQFGVLQSSLMVGMLLGNMLVAVKLGRTAGKLFFKSLFFNGAVMVAFVFLISPFVMISTATVFACLLAINLLWGFSSAIISIPLQARIQRAVPSELRSRVFSALGMLVNISTPLGLMIIGPLLDLYPAWKVALGIWSLMFLVVIIYYIKFRDVLSG
ncbi:MFS transporter [Thermococcus sp. M39]|uniref:MFS transporter n=1 Tax=unclassified Thermococcus TaxID=2627626 RepID=UPI0014398EAF|nr:MULTISPECIES: MFS transporter [unclassified Thermococcus]NJE07605.1 MFS transporter [Thermococcus sp. M39]NJE12189.1 MFS transporter [Thermococcus sp. LS2]